MSAISKRFSRSKAHGWRRVHGGDSGDVYAALDGGIRADLLDRELVKYPRFNSDRRQLV